MIVPAGIGGHDPAYRSSISYDPALANKLLDHFGYRKGSDGYRRLPDGRPLVVNYRSETTAVKKIHTELWKRSLERIGLRFEASTSNFADNVKAATACTLPMWGSAWVADFPDGENFLQLLYGPNAGRGNHSCYQSAAYDDLYRKATALPPGDERYNLYAQMTRQMEADTPWSLHVTRVRNWLVRPWVKGFKKHPMLDANWQYLDVEKQ
jgi:ABC-type transport system substrate-binding protein